MLPIWEVSKKNLFAAFGWPALITRSELREIAGSIWPVFPSMSTHSMERDAAMVGLKVQLSKWFMPRQLIVPA
jgi:hypothetical protein